MIKALKIFLDFRYRVFKPFRRRRHELFLRVMRPGRRSTILDVGGTPDWWRQHGYQGNVILGNIQYHFSSNHPPNFRYLLFDGRDLPFPDKSFDIVFSNSVIEHVGTWQQQQDFACEISRVGRGYWIQTPNKSFPFEPHFNFPLFQYLPLDLRLVIAKYWPFSWSKRYGEDAQDSVRDTRLLTLGELRALFPDGNIYLERFLGLTKSIVVFKADDGA